MARVRMIWGVGVLAAVAAACVFLAGAAPGDPAEVGLVRMNTAGYAVNAPKRVLVLTRGDAAGTAWTLRTTSGRAVARGSLRADLGSWNRTWRHVWAIDILRVRDPGTYQLSFGGSLARTPPGRVTVLTPGALYGPLLANSVRYFQAQRDGAHVVPGALHRQPAHRADAAARVYPAPSFTPDGSLRGTLGAGACCVDVSGGWADAGDYLKFVETASYTQAMLLVALRDSRATLTRHAPGSAAEAAFGMDWLTRMWRPDTSTLLTQVGIGDGNAHVTGDHDRWRLPQADDAVAGVDAARPDRYLAHRPVFAAGPGGAPISPNLAGRMAGDFALCWQVWHVSEPARARACIIAAEHVLAQADLTWTGRLVTTYPFDFYPEESWHEDIEFGAAEIALALQAGAGATPGLAHADPVHYVDLAMQHAHAYLHSDQADGDALSMYDIAPLAHRELVRAMRAVGRTDHVPVSFADLRGDLRDQLQAGAATAARDPFGLAVGYTSGADAAPRALGYALTERWYRELGGATRYTALARRQVDWTLGANAWGTSFVVGAGASVRCLHHQVANLAGSRTGRGPARLLGAVVAGPAPIDELADSGTPDGALPCSHPLARTLDGHGARVVDSASAWASTEPANDYVAPTTLLFAVLAS